MCFYEKPNRTEPKDLRVNSCYSFAAVLRVNRGIRLSAVAVAVSPSSADDPEGQVRLGSYQYIDYNNWANFYSH